MKNMFFKRAKNYANNAFSVYMYDTIQHDYMERDFTNGVCMPNNPVS
jgi:hypothetical protein